MYHILICDDEQDIVNALKIYLMNPDFKLFEANTGVQALEVMEREDIHLILLDIMMPEMDGISAMVKIREKSNVPIILLTAKSEDTGCITRNCRAAGSDCNQRYEKQESASDNRRTFTFEAFMNIGSAILTFCVTGCSI